MGYPLVLRYAMLVDFRLCATPLFQTNQEFESSCLPIQATRVLTYSLCSYHNDCSSGGDARQVRDRESFWGSLSRCGMVVEFGVGSLHPGKPPDMGVRKELAGLRLIMSDTALSTELRG
jgi:hypothetical protein